MKEFEAEVVGVGILMVTKEPEEKLIDNYHSLIVLEEIDSSSGEIIVKPSI